MKTAALYRRVSTEDQGTSGLSLEAQAARLRAYCVAMGLTPVGEFVDVASAASVARPGLAAALASGADVLVVTGLDRLTRSVRDLGDLLEGPLSSIRLVSLGESIDTTTAAGRLVAHVLASVAQWEREAISERTSRALRAKIARGERVGRPRYGYDAQGVPLAAEQLVITRARALRAEGASLAEIARALPAPRSGRWHAASVARMLRAP